MIPKFNKNGYLPKGIYKATLNGIKKRFGSNSTRRKKLFKDFRSLVILLRKHKRGITKFLLNGSFVTNKRSPNDLDCILILNDNFDINSPDVEKLDSAKEMFNTHLFMYMEKNIERYKKLIILFGHDRDKKPKGYVEVLL